MTTELATTDSGTALTLAGDQTDWTPQQRSALEHIGVQDASEGDLAVFFHVCKRTGLDPFARQIYMIGREVNVRGDDGQWHKETKQTIQTGIDGFRLIGRRAADRARVQVGVPSVEWFHEDGTIRPVWRKAWGNPVAARATVVREDQSFVAVANFDEYAQTKRNGDLTSMWAQRPAGQIAKCAEALAWRMAFPQDLAGLYTDTEMDQASSHHDAPAAAPSTGLGAVLDEQLEEPVPDITTADIMLDTSSKLAKHMFALCHEVGVEKDMMKPYFSDVVGREITSSKELTEDEARAIIVSPEADKAGQPGGAA